MISELVYIPFHDWRKIYAEGNRTRDAHFIDKFRTDRDIKKLIILNRPITYAELFIKKKKVSRKIEGDLVFKSGNGRLYKIDHKTYIIDFFLNQIIKHSINEHAWFFEAFGNLKLSNFYYKCLRFCNVQNVSIISANIFSYRFISNKNNRSRMIFDAWDNFYLMPNFKKIKNQLFDAYKSLSENIELWVTDSEENKLFFIEKFNVKQIKIIKNGVDFNKFTRGLSVPKDLKTVKENNLPIVGFGGKITHLFDVDLFNYLTEINRNYNFVLVGQILNRRLFSKIKFFKNVYYLGDKKYNEYPSYVTNFDIGIIPYKTGKNQHGGDCIKAYEYIAAGIIVIGTPGNGLSELEEYIHIANSKESFSEKIKNGKHLKMLPKGFHSWRLKERELLSLLK